MHLVDKRFRLISDSDFIEDNKMYRAIDRKYDRNVLLRIFQKKKKICDEFMKNLINELTIISNLSSPYILKPLSTGIHREQDKIYYYIASEYFESINLEDLEEKDKLNSEHVVKILIQIFKALEIVHSMQSYHGSLRPRCIHIDYNFNVKISDFGITRANKGINIRSLGNNNYVSPNQISVDYTDKNSDFFSLGIILHEILFKIKPFGYDLTEKMFLKNMDRGIDWSKYKDFNNYSEFKVVLKKLLSRRYVYDTSVEAILDLSDMLYEKAYKENKDRSLIKCSLNKKEKPKEKIKSLKYFIILIVFMAICFTYLNIFKF